MRGHDHQIRYDKRLKSPGVKAMANDRITGDSCPVCLLSDPILERAPPLSRTFQLQAQGFVAMWFDASTADAWEHGLQNRFVTETNANPKPFMWTADPRRVLAAVKRGKQALESVH